MPQQPPTRTVVFAATIAACGLALTASADNSDNRTARAATTADEQTQRSAKPLASEVDVIIEWNEVVLDVIRFNGFSHNNDVRPPLAARLLAMAHVTMFNIVNKQSGGYHPYPHLVLPDPPAGFSVDAAVAMATYTVLMEKFEDMDWYLDPALQETLDRVPDGKAKDDGMAFGELAGLAMLELRADDGHDESVPYQPTPGPGNWKPTFPTWIGPWLPQWPYVTPWAMESGDQFRVGPPPDLTSQEYTDAFFEVKELGHYDSQTRTKDQTETAWFWDDGPGTSTPAGHWNNIARTVSEDLGLTMPENARMLALLNMTLADAAVASWDNKFYHDHWRPITGIWEADSDGNPDTVQDPDWLPLIITPPFQAYTSGHSSFSGSAAPLLALYFGSDDIAFCDTTEGIPENPTRCYNSFSEAAEEAGMSRIYGGIHWMYDNIPALESGALLAEHVYANFLRKIGDLNGDGKVDGADLGILLANWGDCDECDDCPADLNGDCKVDGADLGILLANWG